MRRSTLALILAAAVAVACGDDEPAEELEIPPPASVRLRADTAVGDTAARPGEGAAPVQRPAPPTGEAGQAAGAQGQAPAGQPGAQPGRAQAGQAGQAGRTPAGAGEAAPTGQRLYTVQVAAFTSPDSAQKWTGRLNSLNLPVWMSMTELGGRTYYRVRVGAVPTVSEARRLGSLLTDRFEWPVWVAPVTPADRMPADAVAATRRVLGGD